MSTPSRASVASSESESQSSRSSKGTFTKCALASKYEKKRKKQEQLIAATKWCAETGRGPWEAAKEFPALTAEQIRYHMQKEGQRKRSEYAILSDLETERLVQWIEQSSDNLNAANLSEISEKVVQILRARVAHNKARSTPSSQRLPLSTAEVRLVSERGAVVSKKWCQNLFGRYASRISFKAEKKQDAKRTKKQHEGVVERHFHGEYVCVPCLLCVHCPLLCAFRPGGV